MFQHLPLLHGWGGLAITAYKLPRFLAPCWMAGDVLALLVLQFMLSLQVCCPTVPLLLSPPSMTKISTPVTPILQTLLLQFLSSTECFFQGRVLQFCLKNKSVVFKWSKWWEMLNFQLLQGAARDVLGQPCAALLSWMVQCRCKNLPDAFIWTAIFSRHRPFVFLLSVPLINLSAACFLSCFHLSIWSF